MNASKADSDCCVLQVIMPRRHRYLSDLMAELEVAMRPPVANYVFLNTYFFLEGKPDANISTDYTIARLRHRASCLSSPSFIVS